MIKYSLYITEKQDQELRALSREHKVSVSEIIRTAINSYLRMVQREKVSLSPSKQKDQDE